MNKAESIFKWGVAIVVILGLLTTFFLLQWSNVLKILMIIMSIALLGIILLQSGRGGGLAVIGGLTDQTTFGTRAGTFLGKLTFLVGTAVIVAIIFLSRLSYSPKSQIGLPPLKEASLPSHDVSHDHTHPGDIGDLAAEKGVDTIVMDEVKKTEKNDEDTGPGIKETGEKQVETVDE